MAVEPQIIVNEESVTVATGTPSLSGVAGTIGIIGAFNSTISEVTAVTSARAAHSSFGTTTTLDEFKGTDMIDYLFVGASSLIVKNITTWTDAETPVAETTLTNAKLNDALDALTHIEFDILVIAEELSDAQQTIVTSWLKEEFTHKFAHGQVAQISKDTTSDYATSLTCFDKNLYWITHQQEAYGGTLLNLNQSCALMAGIIAGLPVNRSLTNKIITDVTNVSPSYDKTTSAAFLEMNLPFLKLKSPVKNEVICVNSELPCELDLAIVRSRDYILNNVAVATYLGEQSSNATVEGMSTIMEDIKEKCVSNLGICKDILYTVEKTSSDCIDIIIEKIVFDGIVTTINITYSIEVE